MNENLLNITGSEFLQGIWNFISQRRAAMRFILLSGSLKVTVGSSVSTNPSQPSHRDSHVSVQNDSLVNLMWWRRALNCKIPTLLIFSTPRCSWVSSSQFCLTRTLMSIHKQNECSFDNSSWLPTDYTCRGKTQAVGMVAFSHCLSLAPDTHKTGMGHLIRSNKKKL